MIAMSYGHVYVAQVAMGANEGQTLKAFLEAEAHEGPSLIIAYSTCIAHGIDMTQGMNQQRLASESGYWPLYRFDPARAGNGGNPLQIDSKDPKIPLKDYIYNENRYRMLLQSNPQAAERLLALAQKNVNERWHRLQDLAALGAQEEN
jgi:pyruvate-ferredoxin/flavodoxin oxidoreductase